MTHYMGLNIVSGALGKFSTDPNRKPGNWGGVIEKWSVCAG